MRYRLRIPDMIRKEDANQARKMVEYDGSTGEIKWGSVDGVIRFRDGKNWMVFNISSFPAGWIEEIKDEPVSADEYIDSLDYHGPTEMIMFKEAFKAGEQNERLRHEPKKTFREWWKNFGYAETVLSPEEAEKIWNASLKNINY